MHNKLASMSFVQDFFRRLPDGLNAHVANISDNYDGLYASERALIARARAKRRNEFSTGRMLMRRALRDADIDVCAIPAGSLGEPVWPTGIVGSLSHSDEVCALITGRASEYISIGFDLELSSSDLSETANLILSPQEKSLNYTPDRLRAVFCAKEAVYKCISPVARQFMEFDELSIEFRDEKFQAYSRKPEIPTQLLSSGTGLISESESGVVAAYIIPNA